MQLTVIAYGPGLSLLAQAFVVRLAGEGEASALVQDVVVEAGGTRAHCRLNDLDRERQPGQDVVDELARLDSGLVVAASARADLRFCHWLWLGGRTANIAKALVISDKTVIVHVLTSTQDRYVESGRGGASGERLATGRAC